MSKSSLQKALVLTVPAIGSKNLLAGLDCFHFANNRVTTFNGSVSLSAPLDFDFPVNGAIPGEIFLPFLSGLGDDVVFQIPNEDMLTLVYGKSKTDFAIQHVDTAFLEDVSESGAKTLLPTSALFAAGLKRCLNSVGGKGGGEAGIYLFIDGNECQMYSSNGYNASRFLFELENFNDMQMFLPAAFCELLLFLYNSLDKEPDEIAVTEKYIRATFGDITLRSGFYANPVNTELRSMINECISEAPLADIPTDLKAAFKRAEIISKGTLVKISYGQDDNTTLRLEASVGGQKLDDVISLSYPLEGTLNVDSRNLSKIIEDCGQIGFNPNYLVMEGKEGYFDYMVSARISND